MTLEEKINHLRTTSMEEARAESNLFPGRYKKGMREGGGTAFCMLYTG